MPEKIFALDIGTRTVVGLILEENRGNLIIENAVIREHRGRAMLDGQIHNIKDVADVVREIKEELEEIQKIKLHKVVVAAAGRALKTIRQKFTREYPSKVLFTAEQVKTLEFAGVQEAQKQLASGNRGPEDYHFVGYSVTDYYLDGIELKNLEDQRGAVVEINLLATFLPRIVVDSLLTVVNRAGLQAVHLTLEPIAAANLVIPKSLKRLNLVLLDIGAGTSDIAFSERGKIAAYGMVPRAGDEITESICEQLLLDFPEGEKVKRRLNTHRQIEFINILGQQQTLSSGEIISMVEEDVEDLAGEIAREIMNFTDPRRLHAIICIGGGSLTPLLPEKLASYLKIPEEKVGVLSRGKLPGIQGEIKGLHPVQSITPVGIALSYLYSPRANFLDITVNGQPAHLFSLNQPRVSDALLAARIDLKRIHGRTGLALTVEVNNRLKIIKGTPGTRGKILRAGEPVSLDTEIAPGDELEVIFGQDGQDGSGKVMDVIDERPICVTINDHQLEVEPLVKMNGKGVDLQTELQDNCKIETYLPGTVGELLSDKLGIKQEELHGSTIECTLNGKPVRFFRGTYRLTVNGREGTPLQKLNDGDRISIKTLTGKEMTISRLIAEKLQYIVEIEFNGERLELPVKRWRVKKNNREAKLEDLVEDGDRIDAEPLPLRVNEILEKANYQPPKNARGKLVIEKNGTRVNFSTPLASGDVLEVYFAEQDYSSKVLRLKDRR